MKCQKCGYEGDMHFIGRILKKIKVGIHQCPNCMLIVDVLLSEPMYKTEFVLPKVDE